MVVEQQVLCALRFYAIGSYQGQVASDRHLAVHQTNIAFPKTAEERAATQEAFLRRGSLPGVVGCVDGTFVAIKGPSKYYPTVTKALYWCRKQYYALNVMVVSDADLRILAIDPRMPGSTHDSYVWRRSWVRQECVAGHLVRHNEYLLGDSGYPLEPWLMTPVPGRPALGTPAGQYNQAHASMKAVVERCIGLLKSRFRCLHRHRTLYHHPKIAGTIVAACAVLHNVCLCSGEAESEPQSDSDSSSDEDSDEEESGDAARERRGLQSRRLYSQGRAVRDRLVLLPSTTHLERVRERLRRTRRRRQYQ
ncbi:putative nuclease HARBI1 [Ixodes scapularis]